MLLFIFLGAEFTSEVLLCIERYFQFQLLC